MEVNKPWWRVEPRDKSLCHLCFALFLAIFVLEVFLGFDLDLQIGGGATTSRWCPRFLIPAEGSVIYSI